ncbi:MAG TPA: thioredoxin-dependent thiol peroxidase [Bacteroidota bacterium]|nr:thioredoxin-dependent thiol peroxidase [Bacteroidota bacterium]
MAELSPGDKAPDFSLIGEDGKMHSLKDFKGKRIVLYFYPKDDTSGCTKEACSFRDNLSAIKRKGAVVVGVSADGLDSHKKFIEKYDLNFTLLSDEERSMLESYDVWKLKTFMGRKYMGIERSTFIIDERGAISHVFRKVKVDGHVQEVLDALS